MILNLPDEMLLTIIRCLTVSQINNLRISCKQFSILLKKDNVIWCEIVKRDFKENLNMNENLLLSSLILDSNDARFRGRRFVVLSKRKLKDLFFLKNKEIKLIKSFKLPGEKKKFYIVKDVVKFVRKLHVGITNFNIFFTIMNEIKIKKQRKYNEEFSIWRFSENKRSIWVLCISSEDRYKLLDQKLMDVGVSIRGDSMLCSSFINGHCFKSLDEIQAIISMTYYLHSFSIDMFRFHHTNFKISMNEIMFRKKNLLNFKWMDAFLMMKKKFDKKFLFI